MRIALPSAYHVAICKRDQSTKNLVWGWFDEHPPSPPPLWGFVLLAQRNKFTLIVDSPELALQATSCPGYSLYFEKVPWLRLVTGLSMPTQAAPRVGPQLILSTILSREVNVALLYGRYFEKEASYLSEILHGQLLRLYLNFYE